MLGETTVELVGIDERKDVSKGLGTGDSIGKFEPLSKPFEVFVAELFDVGKAIHSAKDSGHDHEQDFAKVVLFVSPGAGVFDDEEGFEALGKAAGIVDFVRVSRHSAHIGALLRDGASRGWGHQKARWIEIHRAF